MIKTCPAMATLAKERVAEFLFLCQSGPRSDLERLLFSGYRATNRLV